MIEGWHTLSHSQNKRTHFDNCNWPVDIWSQSSSGETVTSLVSVSPALPKKERRYRKKRSRDYQEETPPEIPVKGKNNNNKKTQSISPTVFPKTYKNRACFVCIDVNFSITSEPHLAHKTSPISSFCALWWKQLSRSISPNWGLLLVHFVLPALIYGVELNYFSVFSFKKKRTR